MYEAGRPSAAETGGNSLLARRINPYELTLAAQRPRTMADLQTGLERLNENVMLATFVAGVTANCAGYENPATLRHFNRGAVVMHDLLEAGIVDFVQDPAEQIVCPVLSASGPQEVIRQRGVLRTRDDLVEARRQVILGGGWGYDNERLAAEQNKLGERIDAVLDGAGVREPFEAAMDQLSGAELNGTSLPDAKYGAALVVLGAELQSA